MEENEVKQPTYEQVVEQNKQLIAQLNNMYKSLQEMNMTNTFKRMDYLFKVMESSHMFPTAFIDKCSKEIIDLMTIPDTPSEQENTSTEE